MTSKKLLPELFNEANRLSCEESKYTTYDIWKMCKEIEKDLEKLENIESKTLLFYSDRKKIAEEYEKWCKDNNVMISDTTNMITWFLCFKLKEWLEK